MTYEKKIISLVNFGHSINYHYSVWSTGRAIVVDEYDDMKFNKSRADQNIARELINLDYDILCLKTK